MRLIFALLLCFAPLAADQSDDFVVLQEEAVHEGDYFATGGSIEVSGIVKGDVYAFGSQILVDGIVEGDVIATGGSIEITGTVMGNARLAGGQIEIDGTIGKNVTSASGNLEIGPQARIGGNAVLNAGVLDFSGSIGGSATITASTARLLGSVGKNVRAYVGGLRIGSRASIGGNLEYSSSEEAQIDSGAAIGGQVTYHRSAVGKLMKGEWKQGVIVGSRFTGALMNFLFSFVIGWLFIRLLPRRLKATLTALDKTPWKAFWMGLLVFILLPLACLLLFITILGFPLALALLAVSLLGFYTAKIFPILWLCNKAASRKKNRLWVFAIGLVIFLFASHIPFIGGIVRMALTFLGLGALFLGKIPRKKKR